MKKFIYIVALFVAFVGVNKANAQSGNAYTFPLIAHDTLTNTDTIAKVIHITEGDNQLGIQVVLNKLSGTVAGNVYLFQSLDGSNYVRTDSSTYGVIQPNTQFTPTGTNIATFYKTWTPSCYYLVQIVSSGTVSAPIKVSYTARKTSVIQKYQ